MIGLRGNHNIENVLAAGAAARSRSRAGRDCGRRPHICGSGAPDRIRGHDFRCGVFQRLEGHQVDATLKALDAFPGNVLVILGGKDKAATLGRFGQALRATRGWRC